MTFLRGAGFPWHPLNLLKSLSCSATTLQKYRLRVLFFLFLLAGSSSDVRLKTRLAIRDPSGLFPRNKTLDKKRQKKRAFSDSIFSARHRGQKKSSNNHSKICEIRDTGSLEEGSTPWSRLVAS
jgi:hypothetical protein